MVWELVPFCLLDPVRGNGRWGTRGRLGRKQVGSSNDDAWSLDPLSGQFSPRAPPRLLGPNRAGIHDTVQSPPKNR